MFYFLLSVLVVGSIRKGTHLYRELLQGAEDECREVDEAPGGEAHGPGQRSAIQQARNRKSTATRKRIAYRIQEAT